MQRLELCLWCLLISLHFLAMLLSALGPHSLPADSLLPRCWEDDSWPPNSHILLTPWSKGQRQSSQRHPADKSWEKQLWLAQLESYVRDWTHHHCQRDGDFQITRPSQVPSPQAGDELMAGSAIDNASRTIWNWVVEGSFWKKRGCPAALNNIYLWQILISLPTCVHLPCHCLRPLFYTWIMSIFCTVHLSRVSVTGLLIRPVPHRASMPLVLWHRAAGKSS